MERGQNYTAVSRSCNMISARACRCWFPSFMLLTERDTVMFLFDLFNAGTEKSLWKENKTTVKCQGDENHLCQSLQVLVFTPFI